MFSEIIAAKEIVPNEVFTASNLIAILLALVSFFLKREMKKIEETIKEMQTELTAYSKEISELKTATAIQEKEQIRANERLNSHAEGAKEIHSELKRVRDKIHDHAGHIQVLQKQAMDFSKAIK